MKIFINYENIKIELNTKQYQSINSIINEYLKENKINNQKNSNDFFLEHNGILLNKNLSLEKYNITEFSILNIREKVKGGASFFSFASKNIILVIIIFILALIPMFILPLGFIPLTASLIKTIIEKTSDFVGKYLICTLNKVTLFKRMKFLIFIIKYIIFLLMIYVIITFPLVLLCVTLKGQSITSNPKNVCGAINAGNLAGLILTMIFVVNYVIYRSGDYVLDFIIGIFKNSYILDTLFNPMLSTMRKVFDQFKYSPVYIIPYLGQAIAAYFKFLDGIVPVTTELLESIVSVGCKIEFSKKALTNAIFSKMNELKDKNEETIKNENKKINILSLNDSDYSCINDKNECCNPKNFISIGNIFLEASNNFIVTSVLKSYNVYPAFILIIEAFFEYGIESLSDNNISFSSNSENEKRLYLRKLMAQKIDKIPDDLKELIDNYLEKNNNSVAPKIQERLDELFPQSKNNDIITEANEKLKLLENNMIEFSKENKSAYIPGGMLFKKIFKNVFLNTVCNIFTTAKSSQGVISKMGEMKEIVDMLQAGTCSGLVTSICYAITLIILIICGIFNIF